MYTLSCSKQHAFVNHCLCYEHIFRGDCLFVGLCLLVSGFAALSWFTWSVWATMQNQSLVCVWARILCLFVSCVPIYASIGFVDVQEYLYKSVLYLHFNILIFHSQTVHNQNGFTWTQIFSCKSILSFDNRSIHVRSRVYC